MELNRRQRELQEEKPDKPLPVRDLACGEHEVVGCLDCWNRIIMTRDWGRAKGRYANKKEGSND